ncbi:MAG: radical SAM protein [Candidatus Cloacimonadaceae bacterium]|nr:radical SAM protein [Candidatus Cloacimonadaceae bacterium]
MCPRYCGVDRYSSFGYCGAGQTLRVNLAMQHFGEEPVLSGKQGSGTIFFAHCNLKCIFCQNHQISINNWGDDIAIEDLAKLMLKLEKQGAHNIDFVTPSHFTYHIAEAIKTAKEHGLSIPIVWNSSAFELPEVLKHLNGLVDIYLPDLKYAHGVYSKKFSFTASYPQIARAAIKEMYAQAGFLQVDKNGLATKGVIIRMLVLPNNLAGIEDNLQWIYENFEDRIHLSIMGQDYPTHRANQYSEMARGITKDEYQRVLEKIANLGFTNVWTQELSSDSEWTPDFQKPSTL